MKAVVFCCVGFEDILEQDLKEILNKNCNVEKGCCIFEGTEKEIAKVAYMCQSIIQIGVLLSEGDVKADIPIINIDSTDFGIVKNTFSLGCSVTGERKFKSNEVVMGVSEKIMNKTKKKATYKNADIAYYIRIIGDKYYFFLDLTSKELSKRDYKVFVNKTSLKGPIAYGIGRVAEIKEDELIVDPFCRSGEIPIEIIHFFIKKSVHFYTKDKFLFKRIGWEVKLEEFDKSLDKKLNVYAVDGAMPNVKAAEKNSKIAGINKIVNFSRTIIEDLDLRFNKNIDKIVTQLPAVGRESEGKILQIYRDFFMIIPKIMKEKGTVSCVGLNIDPIKKIAELNGYKIKKEKEVMQGKEMLKVFVFEKK